MIKEVVKMVEWIVVGFIAYTLINAGYVTVALTLIVAMLSHSFWIKAIKTTAKTIVEVLNLICKK